jgi:hypothetical protein
MNTDEIDMSVACAFVELQKARRADTFGAVMMENLARPAAFDSVFVSAVRASHDSSQLLA